MEILVVCPQVKTKSLSFDMIPNVHFLNAILLFASVSIARGDDADKIDFFESKIRPALVEHCYECHSLKSDTVQGGLVLDHREGMRRGGDSGASVVPGKPNEGSLLDAIRYESFEMPPSGKLPDEVIRDFEIWIKMGAPDPRDQEIQDLPDSEIDFDQGRKFWSFQQPSRSPLPQVSARHWPRTSVDYFVLQKLEQNKIKPNSDASKAIWLRRVTFDLIGTPPPAEDVEAFLADRSPGSFGREIDRLLSSPALGERWGRMWMDVMRYAEDQAHIVGNNRSLCYPNAYMYRDWLIDAFNADMPYDQFIQLQLAADLVSPEEKELHVALGFIGLGPKYYRRNDPEVMADELEDRIDTLSRGLLGVTVACARCHDHKFDPISTEDYYGLAGVFASIEMFNRPLDDKVEQNKDGAAKKAEQSMHLVRDSKPRDINVMIRGDAKRLGPVVPRRFLSVLCSGEPISLNDGSGRAQLAAAITAPENPLTARVFVNRVWQQLFGTAIVDTPSNFGSLGSRPSHPELLDDLSIRFMESGWSIKWLLRELTLSSTYRQDSDIESEKQVLDPANRLLWRMSRRRLSVEQYRDALLSVSGLLDQAIGGTSIQPDDPGARRRSIYSEISRLEVNSMLARFDFPDPNAHSPSRSETTTPLQKLFMLNSPLVVRVAEAFAERISEGGVSDADKVAKAYRILYAREVTDRELAAGQEFLRPDGEARLVTYCQALLAANEMFMID